MKDEKRINHIVDQLNDTFPTHSYPITLERAQEIGVQAEGMPDNVQEVSAEHMEILEALTRQKTEISGDIKLEYAIDSVFETIGFRTVYFSERKHIFINNKWELHTTQSQFYSYRQTADKNGSVHIRRVD